MTRIGRPPVHGKYVGLRKQQTLHLEGKKCTFLGCRGHVLASSSSSYCGSADESHLSQVLRYGAADAKRAWASGLSLSIPRPATEQAFIYLLEFEHVCKVGRTVNPTTRFAMHVREAGPIVEEHWLEWVSEAVKLEAYLLRSARRAGLRPAFRNEWFPRSAVPVLLGLLDPVASIPQAGVYTAESAA